MVSPFIKTLSNKKLISSDKLKYLRIVKHSVGNVTELFSAEIRRYFQQDGGLLVQFEVIASPQDAGEKPLELFAALKVPKSGSVGAVESIIRCIFHRMH